MEYQFRKHYTREEARALLPEIRLWIARIGILQEDIEKFERRLNGLMQPGADMGGTLVNSWIRALADLREILVEFQSREIQLKDVSRGLVDFPAIVGGKEVFLCWEKDETDVEFWHDLDTGFAGRERLK